MQFAFKKNNSPVSYCAMSIKTGTRDECTKYGGLAHFTEHLIFKGTENRSANTINSYIERLGGELNAYTTKEETVIHATILKEDISKAINLLVELSFRSIFPDKELEKEKAVVMEEINSYKDSPADQIFDDFEELFFQGTPLSMPVLGKVATLKRINRDILINYYHEHFIPSNMTFTVVADMDEKKVRRILAKALDKYATKSGTPQGMLPGADGQTTEGESRQGMLPGSDGQTTEGESRQGMLPARVKIMGNNPPFTKTVSRKNHQAHCIIGAPAYSYYSEKRIPLILLANILGGPASNSRLNLLLREKNALVYGVETSYSQYEDTGIVTIYFGCDKDNLDKCISLVRKVLAESRDNPMNERTLKEAKKQLLGQLAISSDNGEAQALSMGKSLMIFGRIMETDEIKRKIWEITPAQLQDVAKEIFAEERLSRLIYR